MNNFYIKASVYKDEKEEKHKRDNEDLLVIGMFYAQEEKKVKFLCISERDDDYNQFYLIDHDDETCEFVRFKE